MSTDVTTPFQWLLQQQSRSVAHAQGLPNQEEVKEKWSGIQFRLNDVDLITPLGDVVEITDIPQMANIPGVKFWVKGLANMRGNLLPVLDLNGFLFNTPAKLDAGSRLLVMRHGEVYAGLIVQRVFGMKHYWTEERTAQLPPLSQEFEPFIQDSFVRMSEHVPVFRFSLLAQDESFMEVTV